MQVNVLTIAGIVGKGDDVLLGGNEVCPPVPVCGNAVEPIPTFSRLDNDATPVQTRQEYTSATSTMALAGQKAPGSDVRAPMRFCSADSTGTTVLQSSRLASSRMESPIESLR